jgi:hypothetical protein
MEKITLEGFVKLINDATTTGKNTKFTKFRILEYDDNIFSIVVDEKNVIYLGISEENQYDIIFETLKKEFVERNEVIWQHDICGRYGAIMIIDEKVIINFDYGRSDGQQWLYLHEGE